MVPCMEPVKHVAALGSKLLQAGGAAAPASGGAVAHEAGEHASIVVDYKLHVTTRANVSKQPADLRAGLSALYRRPTQKSGHHLSGEHPELAEAWPGRRRRSHARQAATLGARSASGRKKHWQSSDDIAQSMSHTRHSCSQHGTCGKRRPQAKKPSTNRRCTQARPQGQSPWQEGVPRGTRKGWQRQPEQVEHDVCKMDFVDKASRCNRNPRTCQRMHNRADSRRHRRRGAR